MYRNNSNSATKACFYVKRSVVQARPAVQNEEITTILKCGKIETTNTAQLGEVVVTNPDGEQYIIARDIFVQRYDPTSRPGEFQAKGITLAYQNTSNESITLIAPWGRSQRGGKHCMIATRIDPINGQVSKVERYIIAEREFKRTYRPYRSVDAMTPQRSSVSATI